MLQSLNASWTGSKITRRTISTTDLNLDEFSFEENEEDGMLSDVFFDDRYSLRNEPQPPPPLSNTTLSFSRSVNQDETTNETAKPSQRQTKWELGEDKAHSDPRAQHHQRRKLKFLPSLADVVLLGTLAPDKFDIPRLAQRGSPLLSNTALSFSRFFQDEPMDDTAKPSQKQTKWELGEDEIMRSDTQVQRVRLRELSPSLADVMLRNSLAPDKPDIARLDGRELAPLASDNLSAPEITTLSPLDNSVDSTEPGSFDIHGSPQDTLHVRRREHYSTETTTTRKFSVKSTLSEDLSRDDKDRGAKLRYLQKRHERQTGFV